MGLSVYDALEDWQAGRITARRAMTLTGAESVIGLYALAKACDVEVRTDLSDAEKRSVERAGTAIDRAMAAEAEVAERPRGVA